MTTSLSRVVESSLPSLSGSSVTYNKQNNIFLTAGYTSAAGNTYYQGIRLSDRIIISYNIGEGYAYTFLNGVNVYGFNGKEKKLIGSRSYYSQCFSERYAKKEAVEIVIEYMKGQAKMLGAYVDGNQLEKFSEQLVEDTYNKMKLIG